MCQASWTAGKSSKAIVTRNTLISFPPSIKEAGITDEEGFLVFPKTVHLIHSDLFSFNHGSSGCRVT